MPGKGATSVEVYGFTGWITTAVAYAMYLCWAYLPEPVLHGLGVTYYPDKYWALGVPVWISVSVIAAYWAYESHNETLVPFLESVSNHRDVYSKDPYMLGLQSVLQDCTPSVPPLADVDIAVVSRVLYGGHEIADAEKYLHFFHKG